jgi:hypothetical protein
MWEATDSDGINFTPEMVKIDEITGTGWENYELTKPVSSEIDSRHGWVSKAGDFYVLSGLAMVVYATE